MLTTTTNAILQCNPCVSGWDNLTKQGRDRQLWHGDENVLSIYDIMITNDVDDAIWALRSVGEDTDLEAMRLLLLDICLYNRDHKYKTLGFCPIDYITDLNILIEKLCSMKPPSKFTKAVIRVLKLFGVDVSSLYYDNLIAHAKETFASVFVDPDIVEIMYKHLTPNK